MHGPQLRIILALVALLGAGNFGETVQLQNGTISPTSGIYRVPDVFSNISSLIHPETKILKGQEVGGPLPYMVLIVQHYRGISIKVKCTGTYLGDGWVLTAQHCAPQKGTDYDVYLGTYDITKPIFKAGIKAVYKAPKPGSFLSKAGLWEYDILLIKLDRVVPGNVKVESVCLSGWKDIGNVQVKSLGWGRSECNKNVDYRKAVLRQTTGVGVGAETCRKTFQYPYKTVCAMFNTAGIPDNGDSGGPLFIPNAGGRQLQIGVFSGIANVPGDPLECSDPAMPGGYTRLSYQLPWISKKHPKVCIIGGGVKPPVEPKKQSSCFGAKCKKAKSAQKQSVTLKKQGGRKTIDIS